MPVFPVYASFTSDIPKGIIVKPETTLSQFLEKANAKWNTSATIVCTRDRMEIDEGEMLHELDSNTQLILCSSLDEFVQHVIQDHTSPESVHESESVHDPITSTPALLQVQDLNEACTSRPRSYMALLFDDSGMEAENTSNISLASPPLTSQHIPLTQSSKKKSSLSVYRKRLTLELPDLSAQFIEDQPDLVNFTSSTRLQIVDQLFLSICKTTLYPYPEDMRAVVNKMLLRYPTIVDINGDGSMWIKCLTNKFKNFRRNLVPTQKAFQCKRKIQTSSITAVTHNPVNDGEDDFNYQFHELAMQAEMRKCQQDVDFLKKRMRYTFRQRNEWISISFPKVADIIKRFPAIIHSEELWHQEVELDVGLEVPTCRAFLASNGHLLRKALKTPQEYDDDKLLMAINHYLNPRSVIVKQKLEVADMQPTVYLEGEEYVLCIEGVVVAQKNTLVDIIHAELCFFYAFNLEYPSGSKTFLEMLAVTLLKKSLPLSIKANHLLKFLL